MLFLEKLITFLIFVHSPKTTYIKKQKEYIISNKTYKLEICQLIISIFGY